MAYNRRNKLLHMRNVLEIYKREKKDGVSTAHVFREHICPTYPMSRSTLYNYLSTPVDKLLKEEDAKKKQLQLF
jgi:hypothetical protein